MIDFVDGTSWRDRYLKEARVKEIDIPAGVQFDTAEIDGDVIRLNGLSGRRHIRFRQRVPAMVSLSGQRLLVALVPN